MINKNNGNLSCQIMRKILRTKIQVLENRLMLLLNCAVYGKKNAASIENKKLNNISND